MMEYTALDQKGPLLGRRRTRARCSSGQEYQYRTLVVGHFGTGRVTGCDQPAAAPAQKLDEHF